ncbi:MAG: hypothetical protein WAQ52_05210 [Terriglobales bacterium]
MSVSVAVVAVDDKQLGFLRLGSIVSLGLDKPSLTSAAEVPPNHKSAGLAFLLSLLVPGAGQMYCGKVARGGVTLAFFALSVVLTVVGFSVPDSMSQDILGVAMLAILVLYVFSFLDAYYVAREINAGTDALVDANNPRVATTLNLLTNGFGYWYLGERNKGWIAFIVLGLVMRGVSQAMGSSSWSLFLLLIPCAMALDAYRIARKQLSEASGQTLSSVSLEPSIRDTRLPAAVPVAFAVVLVLALAGVIGIGLAVPPLDRIDQSRAVIDQGANPKRYENPTYGVRMLAPTNWEIYSSDKGYLLATARKGQGCQVMLIIQGESPFHSLTAVRDTLSRELLQKNTNFRKIADRHERLGNLSGEEAEFVVMSNGNEVLQRYLMARRGLVIYGLITTMASSLREECEPDAKWIRENIFIQK